MISQIQEVKLNKIRRLQNGQIRGVKVSQVWKQEIKMQGLKNRGTWRSILLRLI
jgi:hypothetical protein